MGAKRHLATAEQLALRGGLPVLRRSDIPPTSPATVAVMAATGWSEKAIARELGVDFKTWKRLLEEEPLLADAYDRGREAEHQELYSLQMKLARRADAPGADSGDARVSQRASEFLLRTRHGYVSDSAALFSVNAATVAVVLPRLSDEEREALLEVRRQRALTALASDSNKPQTIDAEVIRG